MGERFDESSEGVLDLTYALTDINLTTSKEAPDDVMARLGASQISGEIKWFRVFVIDPETKELNVLYSWGELSIWRTWSGKKLDRPTQFAMQFRGVGNGEIYFESQLDMFHNLFWLMSLAKYQAVCYEMTQKPSKKVHLGQRWSTRNTLICRVNGMRAFFESSR